MVKDEISQPQKIKGLSRDLGYHHKTEAFDTCKTMGEVVLTNIQLLLQKDFKQSIESAESFKLLK